MAARRTQQRTKRVQRSTTKHPGAQYTIKFPSARQRREFQRRLHKLQADTFTKTGRSLSVPQAALQAFGVALASRP